MALTYLDRLNRDLCSTARFLRKDLPVAIAQALGKSNAADLDASSFAAIVRDPAMLGAFVNEYSGWPLYSSRLADHAKAITDVKTARERLETQERHVRWQVYRLYRVRNEIVHSARHSVPLLSLVAHLEYYLKTVTQTILMLCVKLPHARRIEEICQRVAVAKLRLYEELKAGAIPQGILDPFSLI
jgi:hypothetical protein